MVRLQLDHRFPPVLHIPDTMANWPWPRAINPHHEEVSAASDLWVRSFDAFNPRAQYAFNLGKFGTLYLFALHNRCT